MSKRIDMTGQRFGMLTVLEYVGDLKWRCKCDCGKYTFVTSQNLRNGHVKSCGCRRTVDITGKRFGRLVAVRRAPKDGKWSKWVCKCDCGNTLVCRTDTLQSGQVCSCGCIRKDMDIPQNMRKEFVAGTQLSKIQSKPTAANKSGVVGVNWDKSRGKWQASIRFQGIKHHLGRFENIDDAIAARKAAEKKIFWHYKEG